ncbi:MAG: FtsH protease activity modulator HflK [Acidiferrobacterales bacterium]|nr:FtsH protease activity modulator HflK [Acidiferrobacterales bacterium]
MPWNEPGSGGGGNKDPWGNGNRNKGNQNPDIDEIVSNLRKRFGGGGNGGGSAGNAKFPLVMFLLFAVGYWLFQSFYQIDEGFQSIELRFGKLNETHDQAGLNFMIWPIDEKVVFDTQAVRTVEVGYRASSSRPNEALMLTRDQNVVDVTMAVQYTIKSLEDLLFNVGNFEGDARVGSQIVEDVVRSATESALREVVGRTEMDALMTTDRPVVDRDTQDLLQVILDRYLSGIQIQSIEIQDVKPPQQVSEAFADVVKADQDQITLINDAEAFANQVVPRARGEAERILQEAEAYRAKVVAEAEGEAERFTRILAEYKKAPEITKKRLYIETMEDVLADSSKVMIDQSAGNGNTLTYLPIDKIIEQRSQSNQPRRSRTDNILPQDRTPTTNVSTEVRETVESVRRGGR